MVCVQSSSVLVFQMYRYCTAVLQLQLYDSIHTVLVFWMYRYCTSILDVQILQRALVALIRIAHGRILRFIYAM